MVVPPDRADSIPDEPIDATDDELLDQVPPEIVPLKVVELPEHKVERPDIAGIAFTE